MKKVLFALTLGCLLSACSSNLEYFTQAMYTSNQWSTQELGKIQFYLSEDVVLRRYLNASESRISKGKIRIEDGREIEEIVFPLGTPGVLIEQSGKNTFAISFDPNNEDNILVFGPSKKSNGRFVILAKNWNKRQGEVSYAGKTYRLDTNDAYASLLVDVKKARRTIKTSNTVSGRKIR